jgi:hypothetical protein
MNDLNHNAADFACQEDVEFGLMELIDDVAEMLDGNRDLDEIEDRTIAAAVEDVRTFADAGLLSDNNGVVLRMKDGSEYQVSIVKSR